MAEGDPFLPVSNPPPTYEDIFNTEAENTLASMGSTTGKNTRSSSWSSDEDVFSTGPPPPPSSVASAAKEPPPQNNSPVSLYSVLD